MVHRISSQRPTVPRVLGSGNQVVYALSDFQVTIAQVAMLGDVQLSASTALLNRPAGLLQLKSYSAQTALWRL